MMSTPKQRAVLREREHTNSIASYVLLMLLMLLLRGGGNRSATEKRQRVTHMVQRQHPLGTYMQTSHVRMCSAQQQQLLLLLLLLLLLSPQFVERRPLSV
jgi:hypothetical protein